MPGWHRLAGVDVDVGAVDDEGIPVPGKRTGHPDRCPHPVGHTDDLKPAVAGIPIRDDDIHNNDDALDEGGQPRRLKRDALAWSRGRMTT